ncbi:MAG: Ig-like domain-containing protein [Candidatus Acidiferrales bacterium]
MKRLRAFCGSFLVSLALLLLGSPALRAQSVAFVVVSPNSATLLVGNSRSFRLVDQNGQWQHDVTWTVSDAAGLQANTGDELTVTAKQPGDFRITGESKNGSADASVKVLEEKMPVGTLIWTSGTVPGCKSVQLVQAMPSANGPDMYDTSHCPDGDYVTALTSDGIQLWRRRIGAPGPVGAAGAGPGMPGASAESATTPLASRINLGAPSVCDALALGTSEQKARDLLHQRNLSFSEGAAAERVWNVEESGRQCKLWFDEKLLLAKKRKIFVSD